MLNVKTVYVLIGLLGGIMDEHEVFTDWRLALMELEAMKDSYNIKTVDTNEETHHTYAHDGEGKHPYIENEIFILPTTLNENRVTMAEVHAQGLTDGR